MHGAAGRAATWATARLRRAAATHWRFDTDAQRSVLRKRDYPDPGLNTVRHTGSISWQQHENEGDLFTAGP